MRNIAHIDKKYVDYERIEQRILPCTTPQQTGNIIAAFTRLYFGANKILRGKRIIGIVVNTPTLEVALPYNNGSFIASRAQLPLFYLTFFNSDGDEVIKDLPLTDLSPGFNAGKTRIFDIIPDIEKSYVQINTNLNTPNLLILFDFYTVDW